MSTVYEEGNLRFTFDREWHAVKWDDYPAFTCGVRSMPGTKAVDFAGHRLAQAWLIEVKDFRGHRIPNKDRLSTGDLAIEVACKVRDSIAGLVWSCQREHDTARVVGKLAEALFVRGDKTRVVLWLEEDRPLTPPEASTLTRKIKNELRWLNPHVLVTSLKLGADGIDGVEVTNLPHMKEDSP